MRSPFRSNDVLVDALKKQDEKAITYFLRRYRRGIFIYCGEDEDITQEAIETALFSIEKYDSQRSNFITWVYGIAQKLFRKNRREKHRLEIVYAEEYLENYDEEETGGDEREDWLKPNADTQELFPEMLNAIFVEKESRAEIEQAIRMLPKQDQRILKNYCGRNKCSYPVSEQHRVFKQLRINLRGIREREELRIRKRLSA